MEKDYNIVNVNNHFTTINYQLSDEKNNLLSSKETLCDGMKKFRWDKIGQRFGYFRDFWPTKTVDGQSNLRRVNFCSKEKKWRVI